MHSILRYIAAISTNTGNIFSVADYALVLHYFDDNHNGSRCFACSLTHSARTIFVCVHFCIKLTNGKITETDHFNRFFFVRFLFYYCFNASLHFSIFLEILRRACVCVQPIFVFHCILDFVRAVLFIAVDALLQAYSNEIFHDGNENKVHAAKVKIIYNRNHMHLNRTESNQTQQLRTVQGAKISWSLMICLIASRYNEKSATLIWPIRRISSGFADQSNWCMAWNASIFCCLSNH